MSCYDEKLTATSETLFIDLFMKGLKKEAPLLLILKMDSDFFTAFFDSFSLIGELLRSDFLFSIH